MIIVHGNKLRSSRTNKSLKSLPKELSVLSKIDPTPRSKINDDWNTKRRIERERREEETGVKKSNDLVNLIIESSQEGSSSNANFDVLKQKVRVMEEQAYRKEKFLDSKSTGLNGYSEVNNMIITSIKAKLAMLKGI